MVAGFSKSGKFKRVTALDPAKPLFIFAEKNRKISKDSARFVDVIHTDCLKRGILNPAGHADFYVRFYFYLRIFIKVRNTNTFQVNGGLEQPGCKNQTKMCKLLLTLNYNFFHNKY